MFFGERLTKSAGRGDQGLPAFWDIAPGRLQLAALAAAGVGQPHGRFNRRIGAQAARQQSNNAAKCPQLSD